MRAYRDLILAVVVLVGCLVPALAQDNPGVCPTPPSFGVCAELCRVDTDCGSVQKCCFNGCGHECTDPVLPPDTVTPTPTQTPTITPTTTPTETPTLIPQGGACEANPARCAAGLVCADDVCCDTACDGVTERCDLPGREGSCTEATAEAPAVSASGMTAALAILTALGLFGILRRNRVAAR